MTKRKTKSSNKKRSKKRKPNKSFDKAKIKHLPKKVTESEFNEFFLPHLSLPQRGFISKIPLFKIFNYILHHLHTGCQWYQVPIEKNPDTGKPELHHTNVFRWFCRWACDGSLEKLFLASVARLHEAKKLDLSVINSDGTNNVAKKGDRKLGTRGTSTRRAGR
jgi:hypothetical protein